MMDFEDFGNPLAGKPLSQADKAAAVLLAMGKGVAGKLLKFFTQHELQMIISSAQTLRVIPPDELAQIVAEFEDLFTEGTGLMDNAKAIESILEEGLTPEEVDSLLGRRAAFQAYEASIWDRLQEAEPEFVGKFLLREHPQTIAYILSMLPSSSAKARSRDHKKGPPIPAGRHPETSVRGRPSQWPVLPEGWVINRLPLKRRPIVLPRRLPSAESGRNWPDG